MSIHNQGLTEERAEQKIVPVSANVVSEQQRKFPVDKMNRSRSRERILVRSTREPRIGPANTEGFEAQPKQRGDRGMCAGAMWRCHDSRHGDHVSPFEPIDSKERLAQHLQALPVSFVLVELVASVIVSMYQEGEGVARFPKEARHSSARPPQIKGDGGERD